MYRSELRRSKRASTLPPPTFSTSQLSTDAAAAAAGAEAGPVF